VFVCMGEYAVAVVGIVEHDGKVLVAKKKRVSHHVLSGAWHIPGGKREADESDEEALVREIEEEAGVKIKVVRFLDEMVVPDEKMRVRWYVCSPLTFKVTPGDDVIDARFVPKSGVLEICDPKAISLWPPLVVDYFQG